MTSILSYKLSATNNTNTEVAQKIDNFTSIVQTVNETGIVDPICYSRDTYYRDEHGDALKERALECLK
jgi:hypothetical protein